MNEVCGARVVLALRKFLGLRVVVANAGGIFEGELAGYRLNGSCLKFVLRQGKMFVVVGGVLGFKIFDRDKIVFEAGCKVVQQVKNREKTA